MLKDIKDEENAALRRAEAEVDTVEESLVSLLAAQNSPEHDPSASPGQTGDDHENPNGDSFETGTVAEGLSPRDLNDVQ
eukprot:2352925-Amphidinium_carterae.1